jgi:hypothetical protein
VVNNIPLSREERYFFFFAGAFLVAFLAAFLVAFFIEKILPKRKICNLYRSQRDSYIRLFAREVKKKNHGRILARGEVEEWNVEKRRYSILFYPVRGTFASLQIRAIMTATGIFPFGS